MFVVIVLNGVVGSYLDDIRIGGVDENVVNVFGGF